MPEICKCPTPGTDKVGKCLAVALGEGGGGGRGGLGGIDWCIRLGKYWCFQKVVTFDRSSVMTRCLYMEARLYIKIL